MREFFFEPRGIYYRINMFQVDRPTIVFVHGLSGSSSAWWPYEKELQSSYNLLSFDLRGHGKSEKPQNYEDYKMEDFAEDLNVLLEYLNIEKCVIVGHSLGSFVVLAFLRKHQEKVKKVIFLAPHFSVKKMLSAKILIPFLWLGVILMRKFPFKKNGGIHIDYSRFPNTGDWGIQRMFEDIKNTSMHVYLYSSKQSYNFDAEDFLKKIHIPTLIVHGKKDTVIPLQYGVFMAENIPRAKLVVLEKSNHLAVLNNNKEIIKEIVAFVIQ